MSQQARAWVGRAWDIRRRRRASDIAHRTSPALRSPVGKGAILSSVASVWQRGGSYGTYAARRGAARCRMLRLRPDLCLRSYRSFFAFTLNRTSCASLLVWLALDAAAVYPAWAAEAYASFWRSDARCLGGRWDPAVAAPCRMDQGGLPTNMLLDAGVLSERRSEAVFLSPADRSSAEMRVGVRRPGVSFLR